MNSNTNLDRFESDYYIHRYPDPQEKEVIVYSTCSGCGCDVTNIEVSYGEILDIYGMVVHDDINCIKNAVEARVATLREE